MRPHVVAKRIRVAHVIETMHMGGVEQLRRTIVTGLVPNRYEHLIICTQATGGIPDDLRDKGFRVEEVGIFRRKFDIRAILRTRRLLKAFKPHIVHAAVYEGIIMGVIAGRLCGVPVIISEETSDAHGRRWTGNLLAKFLYLASDKVIAVSDFVRHYLIDGLKLHEPRVELVPNAVAEHTPPSDGERAHARRQLAIPEGSMVFATLGRLDDEHKGVSDAIQALAQVHRPDWMLLVIGDGPDRANLESLARKLGVDERVLFVGYQAAPASFLAAADIFLHPARYEAFGLVLVEAMFARLPVVASRVGGIPFVVEDGATALLVAPNNVEELAAAMGKLSGDHVSRAAMGMAGLARAQSDFGIEQYLARIDDLYTRTLAAKSASQ